jgi:hypothetical protein
MIKMTQNVFLLAVLFSAGACSSGEKPVDIGDGRTGDKLEDYAAHWEGYAEAHNFDDGSDKVRIILDTLGNGTLEIGDSPALPIATDPDVGYPLNYDPQEKSIRNLLAGFSYPVSATVASARVRFSINPWDLERDWCALQTSYPVAVGDYLCVQFAGGSGPADGSACYVNDATVAIPVDCRKRDLCMMRYCSCDAQGCTRPEVPPGQPKESKFDAALDATGDLLTGTLLLNDKTIAVRLHRL